ncbi:SlyX family protein [Granulosicoccaceae sp. 1_MG-2023]|nr:SlyX family protein [Granulosicoccaceae sp. 1_MG-2023]
MDEQRVIDLEIKLMDMEHTLSELNDTIISQQQRIERLELVNIELNRRLAGLDQGAVGDIRKEPPPPHY